jgi:hypothetical protein
VAGCAATLMTSISAVSLLPFVSGPSITEITGIPASDPGAHSWALGHIRRCTTRYRFANRHGWPANSSGKHVDCVSGTAIRARCSPTRP